MHHLGRKEVKLGSSAYSNESKIFLSKIVGEQYNLGSQREESGSLRQITACRSCHQFVDSAPPGQ